MNDGWKNKLDAGEVVLIDGGVGSEIRRRGVGLSEHCWNGLISDSHPDLLREIHADYIRAGAEVITTSTFGTTRFVLDATGCGDRFEQINRQAIEIAQQARDTVGQDVAIAGSISCLPPSFNINRYPSEADEKSAYQELADLFAEQGADLIMLEMMQDVEHASLACEAAAATGLAVWLGVSCRLDEHGALVSFDYQDVLLCTILDALLPYDPAVVNVMHAPPEAVRAALLEVRKRWPGPIGAYPLLDEYRGGIPSSTAILSPAELAEFAAEWIDSGARVLGGCCATTPDHIRALRGVLTEQQS